MSFSVVVLAFHSQQIFTDAQIPLPFLCGLFMTRGPLPRLPRYLIKNTSNSLFKDYQTFLDLRKLEERINTQQWTSSDHWAEVAARYGPHG